MHGRRLHFLLLMRPTKKLTLTALLAALSVVLLWLGRAVEIMDLSLAVIASLFVVFAKIELGGHYPYLLWLVSAALSLLWTSGGSAALFYAVFAGYYPIWKAFCERRSRLVEWVCKLFSFVFGAGLFWMLATFVFMLPSEDYTTPLLIAFLALALVTFLLYDVALSRLIRFYSLRIRPRIAPLLK